MYANLIPAGCLLLDFTINKIKMKLGHFWFLIILLAIFFVFTYTEQNTSHIPNYIHWLNWNCDAMPSYLVRKKDNKIYREIRKVPCEAGNFDTDKYECKNVITDFLCPKENLFNSTGYDALKDKMGDKPMYSPWKNCWMFVTIYTVGAAINFFIFWYIHKKKLMGT